MKSFYKCILLILVFCWFKSQNADACVTPKPEIEGNENACETSFAIYKWNYEYDIEHEWSVENGTIIYGSYSSVEVKWHNSGEGKIKLVVWQNGCKDSVIKTVNIQKSAGKFFNAGEDVIACHGDYVTLGNSTDTNYYYAWYKANYLDLRDNPVALRSSYNVQALGYKNKDVITAYKVVGMNALTGCLYIDTVKLTVRGRLVPEITGARDCVNDSETYTYIADTFPKNAVWKIHGGEIISGQNTRTVQVKWIKFGKDNKLILNYQNGACTDSVFISTALSAFRPPFNAGPDVTACHLDSVTLGMPPIPNCIYRWDDLRWIHLGGPVYGEALFKKRALGRTTEIFRITYKVTLTDTISGCKFIDTVHLTIKPRQKLHFTKTEVGCYKDVASFTVNSLPQDAYWAVNGGEIIGSDSQQTVYVRWNRHGQKAVAFRYNINDCNDSVYYSANIDSLTKIPIRGADTIFENTQHTYTVKPIGNTQNFWGVKGGEIVSENENNITVKWGSILPGAHIWNYKTDSTGCNSDTAFLPVKIKNSSNLNLSNELYIYPNPFKDVIYISPVNDFSGEVRIIITDMLGRQLAEHITYMVAAQNAYAWNLEKLRLKQGLYHISVHSKHKTANCKLLKR